MKICDLHTHSVYSDGTLTPTQLARLAKESGISAIALTDHNTVNGLLEFEKATKEVGIEGILGAEVSTEYNGIELHVLGLFIPKTSFAEFKTFCKETNDRKAVANKKLVEDLNAAGYIIDYEKLLNSTKNKRINRAHIAAELTEKGYCESIRHAFDTLIRSGGEFYTPPKMIETFDAIEFLKNIGAVPVIAHPFYSTQKENLKNFWATAKEKGLVGMETLYPMYDVKTTKYAVRIAKEYGFLESGGSDFHGKNKPYISIGSGRGDLCVPFEFYEKLKQRAL